MPSETMLEEIIFELAGDITDNSKAVQDMFWFRNRINSPVPDPKRIFETGDKVFINIEKNYNYY